LSRSASNAITDPFRTASRAVYSVSFTSNGERVDSSTTAPQPAGGESATTASAASQRVSVDSERRLARLRLYTRALT
jgi:hypothetical protein